MISSSLSRRLASSPPARTLPSLLGLRRMCEHPRAMEESRLAARRCLQREPAKTSVPPRAARSGGHAPASMRRESTHARARLPSRLHFARARALLREPPVSLRSVTAREAAHGQRRFRGSPHAEGGSAVDTSRDSPLASHLLVRPAQARAEGHYAARLIHEALRTTEEAIARACRPGREVRALSDSLRARVISKPTEYAQFASFSCGDPAASRSVREVQATIRMMYAGRFDPAPTVVVIESDLEELRALCCLR